MLYINPGRDDYLSRANNFGYRDPIGERAWTMLRDLTVQRATLNAAPNLSFGTVNYVTCSNNGHCNNAQCVCSINYYGNGFTCNRTAMVTFPPATSAAAEACPSLLSAFNGPQEHSARHHLLAAPKVSSPSMTPMLV